MARIVKEASDRQTEILAVAQQLFSTKGYEQTSVQDIIDCVGIAKGTLYHHYSSKEDLVDALVERMLDHMVPSLVSIVEDDRQSALEKMQRFFSRSADLKIENQAFSQALLQVWLTDDSAVLRQKILTISIERVAPLLSAIIHQGVVEGSFSTDYPDDMGAIVLRLGFGLSESLTRPVTAQEDGKTMFRRVLHILDVYEDVIARLLGAPTGSIVLTDRERFRPWFEADEVPSGGHIS